MLAEVKTESCEDVVPHLNLGKWVPISGNKKGRKYLKQGKWYGA